MAFFSGAGADAEGEGEADVLGEADGEGEAEEEGDADGEPEGGAVAGSGAEEARADRLARPPCCSAGRPDPGVLAGFASVRSVAEPAAVTPR
ncbi:hypothetical protein ACFVGY_30070 [Streptomyces sp. NPDC127106]|uniref:hypothetical protein n=1 Tax=Streptomyces sp. NPDC127106 TaxID=3345360 RepID=UPI0036415075